MGVCYDRIVDVTAPLPSTATRTDGSPRSLRLTVRRAATVTAMAGALLAIDPAAARITAEGGSAFRSETAPLDAPFDAARVPELHAMAGVYTGDGLYGRSSARNAIAPALPARAREDFLRLLRTISRTRSAAPFQALDGTTRTSGAAASESVKGSRPAASRAPAQDPAPSQRANQPVVTVTGAPAGQAGYVHYFLLQLPDESLEIQVGIELAQNRIAWSFPGRGVSVSPFVDSEFIRHDGKEYVIWHLYGIRPFPDEASMIALQKDLPGRIKPWLDAKVPYCENDGPRAKCMSCLGFVLRALFPGRVSDFPVMPADFWRTGYVSRYSTHDLLLYLTGMLALPTRDARLQRIEKLGLPETLRTDLSELVYGMTPTEAGAKAEAAPKKAPASKPSSIGTRPAQRRPL